MPTSQITMSAIDEFVASRLSEVFGRDTEAGWNLINNGIFADRDQENRVTEALIRRGTLFGCPNDNPCSAFNHVPFNCDCDVKDYEGADDDYPEDDEDDEDDVPTTGDIYQRALRHYGGNTELAQEAASLFPGDWM